MKPYAYLLLILLIFNCNNERVLQLPEIENADITEVLDVSPAYIFYDETEPDSTLFNRKNLIGTTNWLVNVDKRLTLQQAIPHIQYLQNKRKKESMHKNEEAKNYFTCNDTSIGNLGFLEFTDIIYNDDKKEFLDKQNLCLMTIDSLSNISFSTSIDLNIQFSKENFNYAYNDFIKKEYGDSAKIVLFFKNSMSFQDYISIKSELSLLNNGKIIIDNNEFIY
ncbi:hypothetical protein [Winogradskyella flava]|uniref:Uncharacterized protein n=1 Tax=Winogradskyella flava TaxID=1884876 RepID=A0A842IUW8_9FLAO|nr:hypothetical protein [Winogradskyella flava]MBC2845523.1 hypothetical protein [Winogradskyella flava]